MLLILLLLFIDNVEYLGDPVEIVARIIVYVYPALLVVADQADLCAEGEAHSVDQIFEFD